MADYGIEIYDDVGDKIVSYTDRLGRLLWHKVVSPQDSGAEVVSGAFRYGAPDVVASAMIVFTDEEWGIVIAGREMPETSHTIKWRRIGDNYLVEWQPNAFEGAGSNFFCDDAQDYSVLFLYGY